MYLMSGEDKDFETRKYLWLKDCEKKKAELTYPIERYCYMIRGEINPYEDQTFEDRDADGTYSQTIRRGRTNIILDELIQGIPRPEGMTDKQYAKLKKKTHKQEIQ
jgi:hypothetical protein